MRSRRLKPTTPKRPKQLRLKMLTRLKLRTLKRRMRPRRLMRERRKRQRRRMRRRARLRYGMLRRRRLERLRRRMRRSGTRLLGLKRPILERQCRPRYVSSSARSEVIDEAFSDVERTSRAHPSRRPLLGLHPEVFERGRRSSRQRRSQDFDRTESR